MPPVGMFRLTLGLMPAAKEEIPTARRGDTVNARLRVGSESENRPELVLGHIEIQFLREAREALSRKAPVVLQGQTDTLGEREFEIERRSPWQTRTSSSLASCPQEQPAAMNRRSERRLKREEIRLERQAVFLWHAQPDTVNSSE